jgi:hypothetical protein
VLDVLFRRLKAPPVAWTSVMEAKGRDTWIAVLIKIIIKIFSAVTWVWTKKPRYGSGFNESGLSKMCYAQYWYLLIQYDRFSFYLLHWKRYRALQHDNAWYPETSGSTTMTMVLGFLPTPFVTLHVTKVLLVSYNTCKNGVWIGVPGSSLNKSFG